jgi:hypothetical protein
MQGRINSRAALSQSDNLTADSAQQSVSGNSRSIAAESGPMKLIPWEEIWDSLRGARVRGNGEMIEVFYETLFKEAVFDDDGAWSRAAPHRS